MFLIGRKEKNKTPPLFPLYHPLATYLPLTTRLKFSLGPYGRSDLPIVAGQPAFKKSGSNFNNSGQAQI
jgi:hypothetical protein